MGDPEVTLRDDDVRRIGDYVKPWLRDLVDQIIPKPAIAGIDQQLLERMVRVEEELKAQRELMDVRFTAVDKRFESMDERFAELISHINNRFEAVDKRFESVDKRFEELISGIDKRFEMVDKRFGELISHTDNRFESSDKRFDDVHESFKRTQWLIGLGFVLLTAVVTVFGLLA